MLPPAPDPDMPDEPDVPLDSDVPDDPAEPDVPDVPAAPDDPPVPVVPELPWLPEVVPPDSVARPEVPAPPVLPAPVVPLPPVVGDAVPELAAGAVLRLLRFACFFCFFVVFADFDGVVAWDCVAVPVSDEEAVPLAPDCWRDISCARRSTSAARAGSVLLVTPSDCCALAKPASEMEATSNTG